MQNMKPGGQDHTEESFWLKTNKFKKTYFYKKIKNSVVSLDENWPEINLFLKSSTNTHIHTHTHITMC